MAVLLALGAGDLSGQGARRFGDYSHLKPALDAAAQASGFPEADYPYYSPCSGCGPDGWRSKVIPNNILGVHVGEACNQHDRDYMEVGMNRKEADDRFRDAMYRLVKKQDVQGLLFAPLVVRRRQAVEAYYLAVRTIGGCHFQDSQRMQRAYEAFVKSWLTSRGLDVSGLPYRVFSLQARTSHHESGAGQWEFLMAPNRDLFMVCRNDQGRAALHVLSARSGYRTFVFHGRLPLHQAPKEAWEFLLAENRDLVAICRNDGGKVAAHVISAASGYRNFSLQVRTAHPALSADRWEFLLAANRDLVIIDRNFEGKVGVRVLPAAGDYQRLGRFYKTPMHAIPKGHWEVLLASDRDLFFVNRGGSGARVQVHALDHAADYSNFVVHSVTAQHGSAPDTWEFLLGSDRGLALVCRRDLADPKRPVTSVHWLRPTR